MTKAAQLVGRVARELRRCAGTEERLIARRNARARVLKALRAVRSHLDREYPAIRAPRGTVRRTANSALRRLLAKGWRQTFGFSANDLGLYAAAGVPVKRVDAGNGVYRLLVPGWAVAIGASNQAQLRAAKKSKELRDAALARAALLQGA